jgi:radical SAM superfamily enzyme YgiQ (UPF0313 family)
MTQATRVLMVYPRFSSQSFWNYEESCALVGAKYPTAPLGLITVAAMLPPTWDIRLVNRNTEELTEDDLAWADMVMTGGMLVQQPDTLRIINMCRSRGLPVVIGGPDATSSPHVYKNADFQVLGEAEEILASFVDAWNAGERQGVFKAELFKVDVTKTPIPRFDLLKFDQYLYVGLQFSRGCPFTCEFCDIIELYGRSPRTKTAPQMLAELDALRSLGYRGHVDFVDDNLIGNKKAVKAFLPHLIGWLQANEYPFEFSTEASINLADDTELLGMLKQANFFALFVGIETPNNDALVAMRKKQNTRRSLVDSVHRIYGAGLFVTAGFIVGFDTEKHSVADEMTAFIQESAIPISLVSLLTALPNTQLTRRLTAEGRLHPGHELMPDGLNDTCGQGLNFDTIRPQRDVLADYTKIVRTVFEPAAYCDRLRRLARLLDRTGRPTIPAGHGGKFDSQGIKLLKALLERMPEHREVFWKTFMDCAAANPGAVKQIVMMMVLYLHLGPFAKRMVEQMELRIEEMDRGTYQSPQQRYAAEAFSVANA